MKTAVLQRAHRTDAAEIEQFLTASGLPTEGVREHIERYFIMREGEHLLGAVGLEVYGSDALLRSLAVRANERGRGMGERLYRAALAEAEHLGIRRLVLLTTTAESYFSARGFHRIAKESVKGELQTSAEFRGACPASAVCMELHLHDTGYQSNRKAMP